MKSVLVIGMGRFGRHLAKKMLELGNDVMIADKDNIIIEELAPTFTDAIVADFTNSHVVSTIGVNNFDICFVTIGENFESSLVITTLLKSHGAKHVITKANRDIQANLLIKIGADEVVYPEREIAEKLAIRYNSKNIFDFIPLTSEFSIYEIPILQAWVGETLSDLDIRRKYKINIIAVKHNQVLKITPGPDYRFQQDDHIVVIGKSTDVFKLTART